MNKPDLTCSGLTLNTEVDITSISVWYPQHQPSAEPILTQSSATLSIYTNSETAISHYQVEVESADYTVKPTIGNLVNINATLHNGEPLLLPNPFQVNKVSLTGCHLRFVCSLQVVPGHAYVS